RCRHRGPDGRRADAGPDARVTVDIHEYQAKELLSGFGVPVPKGGVAYSAEQAVYRATEVGGTRWVVKAQIHSGARGRAGGVKVCTTDADVRQAAKDLLGKTLVTVQTGPEGLPVHRLLVEQALPLDRERLFDQQAMYRKTLRTGLNGHERLTQQVLCRLADVRVGRAHLHASGPAAGARVDLRLHDPARAAHFGRPVDGLLGAVGDAALRHGDAEARQQLVGERKLGRMNGPFAFVAERRRAAGRCAKPVRVLEVAIRAIDRAQPVGATRRDHADERGVPLVAGVVGIQTSDAHGAGVQARGKVGDAEV